MSFFLDIFIHFFHIILNMMQHELDSMSVLADSLRKHVRLDHDAETQVTS